MINFCSILRFSYLLAHQKLKSKSYGQLEDVFTFLEGFSVIFLNRVSYFVVIAMGCTVCK